MRQLLGFHDLHSQNTYSDKEIRLEWIFFQVDHGVGFGT